MSVKETVLQLRGLVTQPNPYGQLPPGSFSKLENAIMRRAGVLESLPPAIDFYNPIPDAQKPAKTFAGATKVITLQGATATTVNRVRWYTLLSTSSSTTVVHGTTTRNLNFLAGKSHMDTARDRYFFTEATSPIVFDSEAGTPRLAGLPAPSAVVPTPVTTAGGFLPFATYVAYQAHFQREFSDGYKIIGAVSTPVAMFDLLNVTDGSIRVYWDKATAPIVAGDLIKLYRTLNAASLDAVGAEFNLVNTYTINSTDITNGYATVGDHAPEDGRGAALYTNEFQEGATKSNWMPPPARDVRMFKGAAFYVSRNDWQTYTVKAIQKVGDVSATNDRVRGIGIRLVTGDVLTGVNTITNVSAADRVGLEIGQQIDPGFGHFVAGTTITSITGAGPYTLTLSTNSLDTDTGISNYAVDVVVVNSTTIPVTSLGELISGLAAQNTGVTIFSDQLYTHLPFTVGVTTITAPELLFAGTVSGSSGFTLKATNGQNYTPALSFSTAVDSVSDSRTNRIFFSKQQQPEAVFPTAYLDVGSQNILKLWNTQDCLYAFCTDGIFRITGDGDDWRVEPFNPTTFLISPDCIDSMDNKIYAWTCDGLSEIADTGVESVSGDVENKFRNRWRTFIDTGNLPYLWGPQLTCDDYRKEVWINFRDASDFSVSTFYETYIYNAETKTWATQTNEAPFSITYFPYNLLMILSSATAIKRMDAGEIVEGEQIVDGSPGEIVFNPLFAAELGDLKQWMSVVYFFEDADIDFTPTFDENSDFSYVVDTDNCTDHSVPVPRRVASDKQLKPGFVSSGGDGTNYWRLMGISVKLRVSSDTLRR